MEDIDPSWAKYGSEIVPKSKSLQFGEELQDSLTEKMEKDSTLARAASITKRNKKGTRLEGSKHEGAAELNLKSEPVFTLFADDRLRVSRNRFPLIVNGGPKMSYPLSWTSDGTVHSGNYSDLRFPELISSRH